jgi:hypothetical protein
VRWIEQLQRMLQRFVESSRTSHHPMPFIWQRHFALDANIFTRTTAKVVGQQNS